MSTQDDNITPEYRESMTALARSIDRLLNSDLDNKTVGFCLMMFPLNTEDHRVNYMANARREDMIPVIEEMLRRFKEGGTGAS